VPCLRTCSPVRTFKYRNVLRTSTPFNFEPAGVLGALCAASGLGP
jgi:hypothetical protein